MYPRWEATQKKVETQFSKKDIENEIQNLKIQAKNVGFRIVEGMQSEPVLEGGSLGLYYSPKIESYQSYIWNLKTKQSFIEFLKSKDTLFNSKQATIYLKTVSMEPIDVLAIFLHEIIHMRQAELLPKRTNTLIKSHTPGEMDRALGLICAMDFRIDLITNRLLGYLNKQGTLPPLNRILNDPSLFSEIKPYFNWLNL